MQVLISLTTIDNDYQQEQAAAAEAAARRLGVQTRIVHAENDASSRVREARGGESSVRDADGS